jgi:hypothetical protein
MDCLVESLSVIKKITVIANRHDIETRSKRLSETTQLKAIQQAELTAVHNLAELILSKFLPGKRTLSNVCDVVSVIIEQMFEVKGAESRLEKQKVKKPSRKGPKDRVTMEYSLLSGAKIELVWFLVFRIVQKNLEELDTCNSLESIDNNHTMT